MWLKQTRAKVKRNKVVTVNNIMHRALASAKDLSRPDLSGLYCKDGKYPDGNAIVLWKCGKLLVWDVTCSDTFAPSYLSSATSEVGAVATSAEEKKKMKYADLNCSHTFTPVTIETFGVFGSESMTFLKDLGCHLARVNGEKTSPTYLIQRLPVAIQWGNAASLLGTTGLSTSSDPF